MDKKIETKEDAQAKPEEATGNPEEGNKPDSRSILERVSEERQRSEKILEDMKVERSKLEELHANIKLGGESGGQIPVEKKEEISEKEYAEKALSGELNDSKE